MATQDVPSVGRPVTPVVAHPRLARSRLVARLGQLPPGGVALLVAPAGYGATSLLALAAEQSNVTPVWMSGPGSPARNRQFWDNLAQALSRVGVEAPTPPEGDHPDGWHEFGSELGPRLSAGPALLLIVDDLGGDPAFDATFQHLVDNLPTNARLLVRVRRTPHLDVSRLLAGGQLVLLTRWDLALSTEESSEYLQMIAPDLPADRRAALIEVAEGWIGALRASVTGTGGSPDTDPAAWLLGPGLDLLFGRWVATLDPVDRDLLVRCSVLDTLTPEACDWIVGRSDSAQRLAGLSEAQVVAPPVGALGFQYRAHGLLQEYLRRQLSARGRQAMAQAHGAAGLWLASQGDVDSAVTQLLDAGQIDKAREVLGAHVAGLLDSGRSDRVRGWYRQAPQLALPEDQVMMLGAAWSEVLGGNVSAAGPHLAELEAIIAACAVQAAPGQGDAASGLAWLRTETLFLRAYLEAWAGRTARARELVGKVRAAYGNDWNRTSPQAAALLGVRLDLWHGDDEAARSELLTLSSRPRTNEYYRAVAIPALGAVLAADDGRAHRARFLADGALAALEETGAIGVVDDCDARLARSRALVDLGDPAASLRDAAEVEGRGASVGHVGYLVLGAVARARALAAGSDWPGAQQALEEARQVLRDRAVGHGLVQVVDGADVELAVESSDRHGATRALGRIPAGRARERLSIRVAGMGGSLTEADAVRLARSVRPVAPRDVVDARMLMAAVTAASRPAEAQMHLSAAATIAHELGMLRALSGRSEEVVVLAHRVAQQSHEQALAALVATVSGPATSSTAVPPLSRGERELLDRLATSEGHRELAADLGISVNTLKTRLRRLYAKLGVHDRASALRRTGSGV